MIPVFLLGKSFLYEQRYAVAVLSAYTLFSAALLFFSADASEADFFIRQVMGYLLAFSLFLSTSTLYAERKTRRIIGIVSKGISRRQYLLGIVLGTWLALCVPALLLAAIIGFASPEAAFRAAIIGIVGTLFAGTLGAAFSTFLHPLIAAILAAGAAGLLLAVSEAVPLLGRIFALPWLYRAAFHFSIALPPAIPLSNVASILLLAAIIFLIGSWAFERRDLALQVE